MNQRNRSGLEMGIRGNNQALAMLIAGLVIGLGVGYYAAPRGLVEQTGAEAIYESNAPLWLIIVSVVALMGSLFAVLENWKQRAELDNLKDVDKDVHKALSDYNERLKRIEEA